MALPNLLAIGYSGKTFLEYSTKKIHRKYLYLYILHLYYIYVICYIVSFACLLNISCLTGAKLHREVGTCVSCQSQHASVSLWR